MMSYGPAEFDGSDLMSTGYLEDVLFQFSSKRRRLLDHVDYTSSLLLQEGWHCSEHLQGFDSLSEITKCNTNSDMETAEEVIMSENYYDSSSPSQKEWTPTYTSDKENLKFSSGGGEKRKKRLVAKVVCPFALVKPGGFEGGMTLSDINERILMPPTRPVRHPVGDFACRPLVSADGPGLSGKAVVAFTRIHTRGRGTITIIRTKG